MCQFGRSGRCRQAFSTRRLDATGKPTGKLMIASGVGDRLALFLDLGRSPGGAMPPR